MTDAVLLRPGQASLADWHTIYRGAPVALDPVYRADVEAGSAALAAILAGRDTPEIGDAGPAMVELLQNDGDVLPAPIARLFVALKLASLAQGMSGVRWAVVEGLVECLARDVLPAIPGSATDRLALSHLFGALTGTGEVLSNDARPVAKALRNARLPPLKLNDDERSALLSGTHFSTALALAGLFEAERVLQSALVAATLSSAAASGPEALAHPRVYKLHRHQGQIDVAAALRELLAGSAPADPAAAPRSAVTGSGPERAFPEMGACLDLLRQAGATLEGAANAVSEERLVLWQSGEIVSGLEDAAPVSFAADLIAMALREIGSLTERRLAMLPGRPGASGEDGSDASAVALLPLAASFNTENGGHADAAANSGEPGSSATLRARKLLSMAGRVSLTIAIEFLAVASGAGPSEAAGAGSADPLAKVRAMVRARIAESGTGGAIPAADLAAAAELVRSGALAGAAGVALPSVVVPRPEQPVRRLSGSALP